MVKFSKNIKPLFYVILFINLFFSNSVVGKIDIITTNDLHGHISPQYAKFMNPNHPALIVGGAGLYKYKNDLNKKSLLFDAGNFFQGHPIGIIDSGKTIIEWMNKLEYNALVPGKDDFILGYKNLVNLSKLAKFPFLASNIKYSDNDEYVFNPYTIINYDEVRIGILGIVSSNIHDFVLAKNIDGIDFLSERLALDTWLPKLKDLNVDIIIVLSSLGVPYNREIVYEEFINDNDNKDTPLNSVSFGYYANDVDVIISGGVNKGYRTPWYDKNSHVYIFQNYGNGTGFGHFLLNYDTEKKLFIGYENIIPGSISQTLFADDFDVDEEMFSWINNKLEESLQVIYNNSTESLKLIDNTFKNSDVNITSDWEIPDINTDNIEIITWNCEFFPTADDSTINALSEAVTDLNADIIAFQEIKERGWFGKLMAKLPKYDFVISQQSSFMDQAIIYKKDIFNLVNTRELFAEDDFNFAGRPPINCDFIYLPTNKKISIINLHMKCCGNGVWRRKKASEMLYEYVTKQIEEKNIQYIILGDWNDDLKDIVTGDEHCFTPFLMDDRFFFPTSDIVNDLSQASYPKEPYYSFLDHILITKSLLTNPKYDIKTIPMDQYMGSYKIYETYISDHMPVLFSFE